MLQSRQLHIADYVEQGSCVLYVMSRDQRVSDNHALIAAQDKALELALPLTVAVELHGNIGYRSREHLEFMLEGLRQVSDELGKLHIGFVLLRQSSEQSLEAFITRHLPAVLYFDFSPLKKPRARAKELATKFEVSTYVVDTHNIIPLWVASDKQEFAAHTFRPKVHRLVASYLLEPRAMVAHPHKAKPIATGISFEEASRHANGFAKCGISITDKPGETAALEHVKSFIDNRLAGYAADRNNIAIDGQTGLSPYLHFGQIASLRVALQVMDCVRVSPLLYKQAKIPDGQTLDAEAGMNALFEEMIVRKELADNFCFYAPSYTSLDGAATWAKDTLQTHLADPREFTYTYEELHDGHTHDSAWNAAQTELRTVGKIHGYMRMYWAKKLLEWSESPERALEIAIRLNDTYSVDGGDPNGYVGILWAIAGVHDRPWSERPVFGKIRYMNQPGLRRKFDVGSYVSRVMV